MAVISSTFIFWVRTLKFKFSCFHTHPSLGQVQPCLCPSTPASLPLHPHVLPLRLFFFSFSHPKSLHSGINYQRILHLSNDRHYSFPSQLVTTSVFSSVIPHKLSASLVCLDHYTDFLCHTRMAPVNTVVQNGFRILGESLFSLLISPAFFPAPFSAWKYALLFNDLSGMEMKSTAYFSRSLFCF